MPQMTPQALMVKLGLDGEGAPVLNKDGGYSLRVDHTEIRIRVYGKRLKIMAYLSETAQIPQHLMVQMLLENHSAKNNYTFIPVSLGPPAVVSCIALQGLDLAELRAFIAEFKEVVGTWKAKFTAASDHRETCETQELS
ncbi:hypothetical protein PsAD2_01925 [Pseudovibrio axinellae]|uniref:Tir chaperone protein (CesT) n=1 Tax=Pseudovibrio axinellae TaxID=989403 RepID=A0A165ZA72_9HYPH|nr:hypothetical protein [Pseudovibrio axinellae]KZL19646.1 hypothetical protein PsAD2_01925 [Pseudovibrio axinellae]SEQ35393.1 hypothetical protein SAMN05421798_102486 [Pseudovibrio axinellae]